MRVSVEMIAAAFPMVSPLKTMRLNQRFGENLVPFYKDLGLRGHDGQDLAARDGTEILSVCNGTVGWVGEDAGFGRYLFLRTPVRNVGSARCYVEAVYGHLESVTVQVNQEVTEGQRVGATDNTGRYTTGSHLHFGTRIVYIIDGQEKRLRDNGYFGYSDPSLFLTKNVSLKGFPVDRRYGKSRNYLAEKVFAFSPVTRRALGRLPTHREITAVVSGGWTLQHIVNPAMFITWTEMTYDEYRQKLREMVS